MVRKKGLFTFGFFCLINLPSAVCFANQNNWQVSTLSLKDYERQEQKLKPLFFHSYEFVDLPGIEDLSEEVSNYRHIHRKKGVAFADIKEFKLAAQISKEVELPEPFLQRTTAQKQIQVKKNKSEFEETMEHLFLSESQEKIIKENITTEKNPTETKKDFKHNLDLADKTSSNMPVEFDEIIQLAKLDDIKNKPEATTIIDSCVLAINNSKAGKDFQRELSCQDNYLDNQQAPELVVVSGFAITRQPISSEEFNIYCLTTGKCEKKSKTTNFIKQPQENSDQLPIGLDLSDIENSVREYNDYCTLSRKCKSLFDNENKAVKNITYSDAENYAKWLSKQTGFNYRLPTKQEWKTAFGPSQSNNICYHWNNIKQGSKHNYSSRYGVSLNHGISKEWISTQHQSGLVGVKTIDADHCRLIFQNMATNQIVTDAGFRLIRELKKQNDDSP